MSHLDYAIGVDLGGTNIKGVVVDRAGQILQKDRFGTDDDTAAEWMGTIAEYIACVERDHGPAGGVGVASPGLADRDRRRIRWMKGRLEGVMGLDWTRYLKRRVPVPVLNDAHAALIGETWLGAARGGSDVVMLTLGTGVGGAIMCDGRLLRGHLGRAGHLGHLSLDPTGPRDIVNTPGSLEDAIGDCTLAARCGGRFASTRALVEAAAAGDTLAQDVWTRSVRALAAAVASIANAVDPEVFILGGGVAQAGAMLLDPLRIYLDEFEWRPTGEPVRIVPAALGDMAGALGAAKVAWEPATVPSSS